MKRLIEINRCSIVFGSYPQKALALADQGHDRSHIQAETGNVLGVHDCTLDVNVGEIVVLMGLSGSGKSTLLRAINRLNPITRGEVRLYLDNDVLDIGSADAQSLREARSNLISMVFQQFALLPWRSVSENVGFGLELSGVGKTERQERVTEQLELVGLTEWADHRVSELSGGMQQRVGLARAFATGAPILLMDEPFSALDPLIRSRLQDELLDLQDRLKKTIVFVSHDLDEAMKIGNRIAIMEGGRIVQCGTAQDILLHPADAYVADFVSHMNPLGVLRAVDVMRAGKPGPGGKMAATASLQTPVADIIRALAKAGEGTVGIIDRGAVSGQITADDIVAAIARYQGGGSSGNGGPAH